jgi:hypothetical protein
MKYTVTIDEQTGEVRIASHGVRTKAQMCAHFEKVLQYCQKELQDHNDKIKSNKEMLIANFLVGG